MMKRKEREKEEQSIPSFYTCVLSLETAQYSKLHNINATGQPLWDWQNPNMVWTATQRVSTEGDTALYTRIKQLSVTSDAEFVNLTCLQLPNWIPQLKAAHIDRLKEISNVAGETLNFRSTTHPNFLSQILMNLVVSIQALLAWCCISSPISMNYLPLAASSSRSFFTCRNQPFIAAIRRWVLAIPPPNE